MIKETIQKLLEHITQTENAAVEIPKEKNHGDYASSIALVLAKRTGKNPIAVAREIVAKIGRPEFLEKAEVAGPGFINFYLSEEFLIGELKKINKDYGRVKKPFWGAKKIMVEHTQPNPFKEFHIGHLMNNAIGESVARILKNSGASVKTVSYHGDVGLHVAKAVWALQKGMDLRQAYAFGNKAYEENETAKAEILTINKKIYEKNDQVINDIFLSGKKASLDEFEKIYQRLGSVFDIHFYESQAGHIGRGLVLQNMGRVFEKGENGAIIFEGEKFNPKTHTRVFLNAEGLPTYEGKEIGLAALKKVWRYDESVTITANEQDAFFSVVEVAIGEVFLKVKGKIKHLAHGILKLPTGKMSSRTGNVVTAESLIEDVKKKVQEKASGRQLDEDTIEQIAIGAIKYSILKQALGSDIIFDFERSISFEGDSGPYLQYSFVRAQSVLQKARREGISPSWKNHPRPGVLEKLMRRFPETALKSARDLQPHSIALYLTELAREFNSYYAGHKIVEANNQYASYDVALVQAFAWIMKNGLWMLGIQVPKKM